MTPTVNRRCGSDIEFLQLGGEKADAIVVSALQSTQRTLFKEE